MKNREGEGKEAPKEMDLNLAAPALTSESPLGSAEILAPEALVYAPHEEGADESPSPEQPD